MERINKTDLATGRVLLRKAFTDLRKQGFLAKQNFMCCSTCACAALAKEIRETPCKYIGTAYYHGQDNDRLKDRGEICVGFQPPDDNAEDWGHLLVGHAVKNTLLRYGLIVEWDGDAGKKLTVTLPRAA